MQRNSLPSTLQSPSVVPNSSNSLQHALSLPTPQAGSSSASQTQPPTQHQQFIQPHAIHHQPQKSQLPVVQHAQTFPPPASPSVQTSSVAAPPGQLGNPPDASGAHRDGTTLDDEAPPAKRRRGRPKGSKTKNRRVDGVLQPIIVPPPNGNTTAANGATEEHPITLDDDEERDELMEIPTPQHYQPQQQQQHSSNSQHVHPTATEPPPSTVGAETTDDIVGLGLSHPTSATYDANPASVDHHPPSSPNFAAAEVTSFYDFQWRVLNLCSQFYEAAGELVRLTSPEVLAQSFQLGSRADPLLLLNNAKEICDFMMARPGALSNNSLPPPVPSSLFPAPPTPVYHHQATSIIQPSSITQVVPNNGHPLSSLPMRTVMSASSVLNSGMSQGPPSNATAGSSSSAWVNLPSDMDVPITHSRSVGNDPITHFNPPSQPHTNHSIMQTPPSTIPAPTAPTSHHSAGPNIVQTRNMAGAPSIHGAWKDWETERLLSCAEQSRSRTTTGEIDWDWTVQEFGDTRSRHQILIKATALNLKPTSTHPSRQKKRVSLSNVGAQMAPPNPPTSISPSLAQQANDSAGSSGSLDSATTHASQRMNDGSKEMSSGYREKDQEAGVSNTHGISPSASVASTPTIHHERSSIDAMGPDKQIHGGYTQYSNALQRRPSSRGPMPGPPSNMDPSGANTTPQLQSGPLRTPSASVSHKSSQLPHSSSQFHPTQQQQQQTYLHPRPASQSMSMSRPPHGQQHIPPSQHGSSHNSFQNVAPSQSVHAAHQSSSSEPPSHYPNPTYPSSTNRSAVSSHSNTPTHHQPLQPSSSSHAYRTTHGHNTQTPSLHSPHDSGQHLGPSRNVGPSPQPSSSGGYPPSHANSQLPHHSYQHYSPPQPPSADSGDHNRRHSLSHHPTTLPTRTSGSRTNQPPSHQPPHSQGPNSNYYRP